MPSYVSGNAKATTPGSGSGYTSFGNIPCAMCTISNVTGDIIEVLDQSGELFPVPNGTMMDFFGISNMNQIGVRKKTAGAVDVYARWNRE